jgi:hypothetical protein
MHTPEPARIGVQLLTLNDSRGVDECSGFLDSDLAAGMTGTVANLTGEKVSDWATCSCSQTPP